MGAISLVVFFLFFSGRRGWYARDNSGGSCIGQGESLPLVDRFNRQESSITAERGFNSPCFGWCCCKYLDFHLDLSG
jgi:hypothetical protein